MKNPLNQSLRTNQGFYMEFWVAKDHQVIGLVLDSLKRRSQIFSHSLIKEEVQRDMLKYWRVLLKGKSAKNMVYPFMTKTELMRRPRKKLININQKIFMGHCYSCNNFRHKSLKCKDYEKVHEYKKDAIKKPKVRNHNPFGLLQRFDIVLQM